MSPGS
ncbi:hypothetical protein VTL71DRAFT_1499 [Oculimacula yallundae]